MCGQGSGGDEQLFSFEKGVGNMSHVTEVMLVISVISVISVMLVISVTLPLICCIEFPLDVGNSLLDVDVDVSSWAEMSSVHK